MTEGGVGLADLWMRRIGSSEVFEGWVYEKMVTGDEVCSGY